MARGSGWRPRLRRSGRGRLQEKHRLARSFEATLEQRVAGAQGAGVETFDVEAPAEVALHFGFFDGKRRAVEVLGRVVQRDEQAAGFGAQDCGQVVAIARAHCLGQRDQGGAVVEQAGALQMAAGEVEEVAAQQFDFVVGIMHEGAGLGHGRLDAAIGKKRPAGELPELDAADAIAVVDGALEFVNGLRADLGAVQSRFESTISNLSTTAENLSAARSRIQDADFAAETAALTRAQILQQAGTSVLAQANQTPQNVLSLLQ